MPDKLTTERKQSERLNQVKSDLQRLKADLRTLEIDTFEIEDIDDLDQRAASIPLCSTSCCCCSY